MGKRNKVKAGFGVNGRFFETKEAAEKEEDSILIKQYLNSLGNMDAPALVQKLSDNWEEHVQKIKDLTK